MILVVSHRRGFEADPVIDGFRSRGIPCFRFNTEFEGTDSQFALRISPGNCDLLLACDGKVCRLAEIRAAWYQQPPPDPEQATALHSVRFRSSLAALWGTLYALDVPWLNRPQAVETASNKVIQHLVAKRHGLPFPDTLISNRPKIVRDFFNRHPSIVGKSLGVQWMQRGGELLAAHTQEIREEWLERAESITFAPIIYQQFVERSRDFRVVVVGHRAFAAVCERQGDHQKFDVRRGNSVDSYTPCEFPAAYLSRLRAMLSELQIDYCSADFIETAGSQLLFVDLNVTGSWWWVDKLYGGRVCEALVQLLAAKAGYE